MKTLLTGIVSLFALISVIYVLLCLLLYWRQDAAIFYPVHNDPALRQEHAKSRIEIPVDGAILEGWWIDNPAATNSTLLLYFGGNAEDVLYASSLAHDLSVRRMLLVNYRGYGGSSGRPGQRELYDDALKIYAYAIAAGHKPEQIVVMGRSLGSGVASMLAGSRPVAAAILVTPFDSLGAVGAAHYPLFPVRLLLRHPFPSSEWARLAQAPALFLAADYDVVVPAAHAKKLFDAWAGRKHFHLLSGRGHNDIEQDAQYYALINEFLASVTP
ncbi:MAG TPA: alpha/beta hydrolase [Povalibacter sp.]